MDKDVETIQEISLMINELETDGGYAATKNYYQHGDTTVYQHCVNVALASCRFAEYFQCEIDKKSLIRGALLHDYFLYDWHKKDNNTHRFHGFRHPKTALKNAEREFLLNEIEKNIILCHMFPLTLIPPMTKEAWIVCIADKWCATKEMLEGFKRK